MVVLLVGIYSEGSVWLVREVRRVLRVLGGGSKTKNWVDCNSGGDTTINVSQQRWLARCAWTCRGSLRSIATDNSTATTTAMSIMPPLELMKDGTLWVNNKPRGEHL